MPHPSPEQIASIVLGRRQVYDLDIDSRIRQVANRLTARALFELLARLDDQSPDFATHLSALIRELPIEEVSCMVGFDNGFLPIADDLADISEQPEQPSEHYLRLVFRDEHAAYYQFHLFPDLDADYVCCAARKRAGEVQHIRIELSTSDALQPFIESCRTNPHLPRVEESTADEFQRAPSNAI